MLEPGWIVRDAEGAMARGCSARGFVGRAAPTVRRMPRSAARTCSELVGGSRSVGRGLQVGEPMA
jgi:hypothetical protein